MWVWKSYAGFQDVHKCIFLQMVRGSFYPQMQWIRLWFLHSTSYNVIKPQWVHSKKRPFLFWPSFASFSCMSLPSSGSILISSPFGISLCYLFILYLLTAIWTKIHWKKCHAAIRTDVFKVKFSPFNVP
jgi:hypothetical protein